MMTSTHILMGAAISSRSHFRPLYIVLAWLGGFTPDASMFALVVYSRFGGEGTEDLWSRAGGLYWQEPWQFYSAVSNSFPMWILFCLIGLFLFRRSKRLKSIGLGVLIFSTAAFAHVIVDFMTHASDAHIHFWPFSDWRFHSPISYYEKAHFGRIVSIFEATMGLSIIAYLVTKFKQLPVRILAPLLGLPYLIITWFLFSGRM